MAKYATPEDEWRAYLGGTHPHILWGRKTFRHIPSQPRCKICYAPFGAPGGPLFRRMGFVPWEKNSNMCMHCIKELRNHEVMGAEVEVSFLFADVRRSSELARTMGTMEFTHLMQRFYAAASEVLLTNDAILDKFVGDEVVGFFLPLMTGQDHAGAAVHAAQDLMIATGHADGDGPWLSIGAGVNTGAAFVGMVSSGGPGQFTAFGDAINVAAHVAAEAAPGEILVTDASASAAGLETDPLEQRHLSLKGHPVDAFVLDAASLRTG